MHGRIVLGVSGGIAAYKAIDILRQLSKHGCSVRVILTRHATELVHPRTFAVLSDHPVEIDQWQRPTSPGVDHVSLSHWADLLLVAPATANLIGKMACGIADDALSTYHLAHRRAVAVAPAMNTVMWQHVATQENLERLRRRGVTIIEPETGMLACREQGEGRLAAPERIVDQALRLLPPRGPLAGLRLLVSAGPTREPIDAVRVLSNRSSGRMGVAIAAAARRLGAAVTLLHGPLAVPLPLGIDLVAVETAAQMERALEELAPAADAAFLAAAVADFTPANRSQGKLDRREGGCSLKLQPVADLAAGLGSMADRPYLVVFAAEIGEDRQRAVAKMRRKGADAVVLNDIAAPGLGMEAARNELWICTTAGLEHQVPADTKERVAEELLLTLSREMLKANREPA